MGKYGIFLDICASTLCRYMSNDKLNSPYSDEMVINDVAAATSNIFPKMKTAEKYTFALKILTTNYQPVPCANAAFKLHKNGSI